MGRVLLQIHAVSVALCAGCGSLVYGNWGLSLCLRSVRIIVLRGVTAARSVGVGVGMVGGISVLCIFVRGNVLT